MEVIQGKRAVIRLQNSLAHILAILDSNYNNGYNFSTGESIEGEVDIIKWIDNKPEYFTFIGRGYTLTDYITQKELEDDKQRESSK